MGPGYNYQPASQQALPPRDGFSVEEAAWGASHCGGGGGSLVLRREDLRILQGLCFPMKNDFPAWLSWTCLHPLFVLNAICVSLTRQRKLN